MEKHINEKIAKAKGALHTAWRNVMVNKSIPLGAKNHLFNSVSRSVLCYAAQVWGGGLVAKQTNKLLNFYVKKLLSLPPSTPDYVIALETKLTPVSIYVQSLHYKYLLKVMQMPSYRYPRVLLEEIVKKDIYWYRDIKINLEKYDLRLNLKDVSVENWTNIFKSITQKSEEAYMLENERRARGSKSSVLYPHLDYENVNRYFCNKYKISLISCVMKIRGELLDLNYKRYAVTDDSCSICNCNETENVLHFLATCEVYRSLRIKYFQKHPLSYLDTIVILNGQNWVKLYNYIQEAWSIRSSLIGPG